MGILKTDDKKISELKKQISATKQQKLKLQKQSQVCKAEELQDKKKTENAEESIKVKEEIKKKENPESKLIDQRDSLALRNHGLSARVKKQYKNDIENIDQ